MTAINRYNRYISLEKSLAKRDFSLSLCLPACVPMLRVRFHRKLLIVQLLSVYRSDCRFEPTRDTRIATPFVPASNDTPGTIRHYLTHSAPFPTNQPSSTRSCGQRTDAPGTALSQVIDTKAVIDLHRLWRFSSIQPMLRVRLPMLRVRSTDTPSTFNRCSGYAY
jgi:hypothetical protein